MNYTEADIRQLLSQSESETLEFKAQIFNPSIIHRVIVALANTEGGRLVFGYDERTKTVSGVFPGTANKLCALISNWNLTEICKVQAVPFENKQIIIIEVEKSRDLLPIDGCFYKRRGDRTFKLNESDIREHYVHNYLNGSHTEGNQQEKELLLNKIVELTEMLARFKDKYDKDQKKATRNNWWFCIVGAILGVVLSVLYHRYLG